MTLQEIRYLMLEDGVPKPASEWAKLLNIPVQYVYKAASGCTDIVELKLLCRLKNKPKNLPTEKIKAILQTHGPMSYQKASILTNVSLNQLRAFCYRNPDCRQYILTYSKGRGK